MRLFLCCFIYLALYLLSFASLRTGKVEDVKVPAVQMFASLAYQLHKAALLALLTYPPLPPTRWQIADILRDAREHPEMFLGQSPTLASLQFTQSPSSTEVARHEGGGKGLAVVDTKRKTVELEVSKDYKIAKTSVTSPTNIISTEITGEEAPAQCMMTSETCSGVKSEKQALKRAESFYWNEQKLDSRDDSNDLDQFLGVGNLTKSVAMKKPVKKHRTTSDPKTKAHAKPHAKLGSKNTRKHYHKSKHKDRKTVKKGSKVSRAEGATVHKKKTVK
jgi:hypothetical protein